MKFDVPKEVISKLFSQGYEEQILDIIMNYENDSSKEVSDIPLSPVLIPNNGQKIIISPKVYQVYLNFLQRINNRETSEEIPFFLLGNNKVINGEKCVVFEDIIFDINNALSKTHASSDVKTFEKLVEDNTYSVISIGHTHGNVDEDKKETSIARTLPVDLKEKYLIRDTGLNISLSDLWQHEAFKHLGSSKEIYQTIIMYNGDMIIISPNNISKSNEVEAVLDKNVINISTGNDQVELDKHM